jgi:hypothetical protein
MTQLDVSAPRAIIARDPRSTEPWRSPDWQRLWLACQVQRRTWRSMAIVPAGPGASPDAIVDLAMTLAHTGMLHLGQPIHVADATRITLPQLVQFSEEIEHYTAGTGMIILALAALSENVTSLSLAQSADCALLCVLLEQMATADAKKTIESIGQKRFIGSAVFKPSRK